MDWDQREHVNAGVVNGGLLGGGMGKMSAPTPVSAIGGAADRLAQLNKQLREITARVGGIAEHVFGAEPEPGREDVDRDKEPPRSMIAALGMQMKEIDLTLARLAHLVDRLGQL